MTKEQILNNYHTRSFDECWIYDGYLLPNGYGHVEFQGEKHYTHRLMYEFAKGPIPYGMLVCHTCDTPSCMNPDHLFLGTYKDNMQDCISKGRMAKGSRNGRSKLNEDQVIEIKSLLKKGNSHREIAQEFGVAKTTVSHINTGYRWRHLND